VWGSAEAGLFHVERWFIPPVPWGYLPHRFSPRASCLTSPLSEFDTEHPRGNASPAPVLLHPVGGRKMEAILRLAEVASGIARTAQSAQVVNFIAVSLVMFLMAVVWLLLSNRRAPPRARRRRR